MTQERLINSDTKRIRCIAGPGTGKTYALKGRVKRLIENDPLEAEKIFAVTYTRLAAGQLRNDLCNLDVEGSEKIHASTLHSYAFKILQEERAIEESGRVPRVCFESEKQVLKQDLALEFGGVREVNEKMNAFCTMWARLQHEEVGCPISAADQQFNQKYLQWMKFHKGIMVDELISLAVNYLRNNPVNNISNRFNHVIVDEYQDLNKADQTLIELIGKDKNMTIVGDDDQSIYGFRHANPEGIRSWIDDQSEPKEHFDLNVCRRCDGKIISLANSLIANNPNRIGSDLIPQEGRENLGNIDIVQWHTRERETKGIALGIKKIIDNEEVPEGEDLLVLVQRSFFGEKIKDELENLGITDVSLKTKMNWKGKPLGTGIAYATLLEDESDLISIRYLLGSEHGTWNNAKYSILYNYCINHSKNLIDVLSDESKCSELRISQLHDRWNGIKARLSELREKSNEELIDTLFPLANDTERIGDMLKKLNEEGELEEKKIIDVLRDSIINKDDLAEDTKIKIMTLHSAKGLSSHTVIIAGAINGILPSKDLSSGTWANLEEDRRLFFVALTRAKKRLILSSFKKVRKIENMQKNLGLPGYGMWLDTSSSMFFLELGPDKPAVVIGEDWLNTL